MANEKISQFSPLTTLASGDYFPIVDISEPLTADQNKRVGVDVFDNRYYSVVSGVSAQSTANQAQASGNAALVSAVTAQASGNAALSAVGTKYAISGGLIDGQMRGVITALGLNGSGIPCTSGNYFTAILSGNSSVYFAGVPANAYSLTYEVRHDTGTITWPGAVTWPNATAPTLTTGKTHLFMFVTDDSGTSWRASSLINYTT